MSDDEISSTSINILFITQYFPPETGAPSNRVKEITRRWVDAGHEVTVMTSAPDYPEGEIYEGYENEWLRTEKIDGVTVHLTKTVPASNAGMGKRAIKFVWFMLASIVMSLRMSRSPDVVIATSPQPLTGISGFIISQLRGSRFVFEVRDLWPETITAVSDIDNKILIQTLDILVKFVYWRADRVVTVSRAFEDSLIDAGVDENNLWYHPNGVDPSFVENLESADPISPDIETHINGKFVISYVGTIGRAHGLEVVLDAAKRLADEQEYDDVLFLVVGYGADMEALSERAENESIDNVVFTGRKPKSMVPSILAETDVSLVHLKPVELFETVIPSKIFESMAARLPIILGVRGEAERIVTEADAGIPIPPGDDAALAEAVRQLHDDSDRSQTLGDNGGKYVRTEFDWDTIAERYLSNITRLVTEERDTTGG
jgi:glycosyltransferase involved in cell wall biosynthesis